MTTADTHDGAREQEVLDEAVDRSVALPIGDVKARGGGDAPDRVALDEPRGDGGGLAAADGLGGGGGDLDGAASGGAHGVCSVSFVLFVAGDVLTLSDAFGSVKCAAQPC